MLAVYILITLIFSILIVFVYKRYTYEGFDNLSQVNKNRQKNKDISLNFQNKGLFINPELQNDMSKINDAFKNTDVLANKNNKKTDYSKFFIVNPVPGLMKENLKCSQVLEPRLLPKHESTMDKGCGWWYMDDDASQSISAIGTNSGPYDLSTLEKAMPGGEWLWDLELAQKKEDIKRCRRIKSCEISDLVPGKCGFCVSQSIGIPINSKGESLYGDDPNYTCSDIITKPANCPKLVTNITYSSDGNPIVIAEQTGLCDPNPLTGQLTKDCLITIAKGVGFTENGAIINILSGDSSGYYSEKGANRHLFASALNTLQTYSSISSPNAYFGDGPCSREEALGYYNTVMKLMQNGSTKKVRSASKFLAVGGSDYDECPDDVNIYGPFSISCLERVALEAGCQPDGTEFPKEIKQAPVNVPAYCKKYGRASDNGDLRLYNSEECKLLDGNFHGNGECVKKGGGSYSWECRELNKSNKTESTKDKYDTMRWGDILSYFTNLYSQMNSGDKDKTVYATKACLGIDITPIEQDCGELNGIYCYCYKWNYDNTAGGVDTPKSLFYGRFVNRSMIEFNNNGNYTPFNTNGTDRIHLRIKTNFKINKRTDTKLWVLTDDGISINVDEKAILSKWFDQGPTQYETPNFIINDVEPTNIQINWFNNGGGYTFVPRIKSGPHYVRIPDTLLTLDQPSNYPFARWDFYESYIEDRCKILNSEVTGNIPIGVCDGKKCGIFSANNFIRITNGISTSAFKSISMMVYIRSSPPRWPRLWEFNNSKLGNYDGGETQSRWCEDSIFGTLSPNNSQGVGFYIQNGCNGFSEWPNPHTVQIGKWHHCVWTIDESLDGISFYVDGVRVIRQNHPYIKQLLQNKIYTNMYIANSVEYFPKDLGIAWFRLFDYTMTEKDIKNDADNNWSTKTLFPKSAGTGWA